jgi:hypothetical protein
VAIRLIFTDKVGVPKESVPGNSIRDEYGRWLPADLIATGPSGHRAIW